MQLLPGKFTKHLVLTILLAGRTCITRLAELIQLPQDWRTCLVIGTLALSLNLYRLGEPSIWFDEALSIERASQPLPVLGQIVFASQPNMALYYFVLAFWLKLTALAGILPVEYIVRFPSAIFAALGTIVVYRLGRRFLGRTAGFFSAALYMLNALQLTYAQETRSYSLQLLLLCLSWYALLCMFSDTRPRQRFWLAYSLCMSLAIYTHLFSLLVWLAQAAAFICLLIIPTGWQKNVQTRWHEFLSSMFCIGAMVCPLLLAARGKGKTGWLSTPVPGDIVRFIISFAGGNKLYALLCCLLWLVSLVSTIILFYLLCRGKTSGSEKVLFDASSQKLTWWMRLKTLPDYSRLYTVLPVILVLFCWSLVSASSSYLISLGSIRLFSTRYLIAIVPALLLLIGLCVEFIVWSRLRPLLLAGILLLATCSVPAYYQSAQVEDWRNATFWLQTHYRKGDGMVCFDNSQGCQLDIAYYLRAYPRGVSFPTDSPGSFEWVHYDLTNTIPVDVSQALNPQELARYGSKHKRLFLITGRYTGNDAAQRVHTAQRWLDTHYTHSDRFTSRTVVIYLYEVRA